MSLDLIHQTLKVLNSNGDLIRGVNVSLMLLSDYLAVRNPALLIRDNVINQFFIDIAPELEEREKTAWNQGTAAKGKLSPLKIQHERLVYPGDPDFLELPMPKGLARLPKVQIVQPVIYRQNNLPIGLLTASVMEFDQVTLVQKVFRILADSYALAMVAKGFPVVEITDALAQPRKPSMILNGIVGQSEALLGVAEVVKKVAASKATVLIRGESGTGKELFAKAIHEHSLHKKAPFVGVNCAALSDSLLESELFGHEKGAFTGANSARKGRFELADGGTLFLDEVGDTSLGFQAKILRVLQEGQFERLGGTQTLQVDVRILCATNVDLEKAIEEGTFREDLYYRLNVITLDIPPLRKRRDDIPLLVNFFLDRLNRQEGKQIQIRATDLEYLCGLDWPGNIRELENQVQSGFLMEKDGWFHLISPQKRIRRSAPSRALGPGVPRNTPSPIASEEIAAIEQALKLHRGVQVKAAAHLGISLRQLRYRIQKYQMVVRKIGL